MDRTIAAVGNAAAVLGIGVCAVAGGVRLLGSYALAGMGADAIFLGGTGLMVFACLAKLHQIERARHGH